MLKQCSILPEEDADQIIAGLKSLKEKAEKDELTFKVEMEDIHFNLESMLISEIGPVGGKLHTGRSRNDQVATDLHLYMRNQMKVILELINDLQIAILGQSKKNMETLIPGYTHLQRAQPISFAHHLMAYFWMLERDKQRFTESFKRINISPLGAGALAGTTFPIDRALQCGAIGV